MGEDKNKTQQQQMTMMRSASIALEFGFVIALPLVLFALGGKWLDARYHTSIFLPLGIILALVSSTIWLYRSIRRILEELRNKK